MANARQRAADRRTRRRAFHLARIEAAPTLVEKLEAAFDLLRSDLINTSDTDRTHLGVSNQLASDLLRTLRTTSEAAR